MVTRLDFRILPQPDDSTCGPTCLHAVYSYYGDALPLPRVVDEVEKLPGGGTLAVLLGCHALSRGYSAALYTYDLQVFGPTWFSGPPVDMARKLEAQIEAKPQRRKVRAACRAYMRFLAQGGSIRFEELSSALLRRMLKRGLPVLTGLSATYLYGTARELGQGDALVYDDVRGEPAGHFVVLCGYRREERAVLVADPLLPNPMSRDQIYEVRMSRLIHSIMLGTLTFDANLLIIAPKGTAI